MVRCVVATFAVWLLAAGTPFLAAPSRDWKRARSTNFVGVGNASERDLRATLSDLEAFRAALGGLFPAFAPKEGEPTPTLVLLKDRDAFQRFAPLDDRGRRLDDIAGYFTTTSRGPFFVMWAMNADLETAFHEYVHSALNRRVRNLPMWVSEGIADFFSTFAIDRRKNTATIGAVPEWRRYSLSNDRWLPLRDVMTSQGAGEIMRHRGSVPMFYGEAWGAIHYLAFSKDGSRAPQLGRYLAALEANKTEDAAFQEAFGMTYGDLDKELRGYLRSPLLNRTVPLESLSGSLPEGSVEQMSQAEAEGTQGCLLASLGSLPDAERHLTAALADDPKDMRARGCLGGLRVQQDRTADALAILEPLGAEAAVTPDAAYELGVALNDAGRHDDAARAFGRATQAKPDFVAAWFELSASSLAQRRDAQARTAMAEVMRLDADPAWYRARASRAMSAGRMDVVAQDIKRYLDARGLQDDSAVYAAFLGAIALRRMGQPKDADALLQSAADAVDARSWTARVLSFLQGKTDARTLLDAAGNNGERTEAHTYAGFLDLEDGRRDSARAHFQWVKDRGSRNYTEFPLALGQLRLLDRAAK